MYHKNSNNLVSCWSSEIYKQKYSPCERITDNQLKFRFTLYRATWSIKTDKSQWDFRDLYFYSASSLPMVLVLFGHLYDLRIIISSVWFRQLSPIFPYKTGQDAALQHAKAVLWKRGWWEVSKASKWGIQQGKRSLSL